MPSDRTISPRLWQAARAADPTPDPELLARFVRSRDGAAFAQLVERHGPMVLGVCRRLLPDYQAAEDAFQAAFLALARNAGRVRQPNALAAWLYGAAYRVALRSRRTAARVRAVQRRATNRPPADPLAEITGRELVTAVDEELVRLPDPLRVAIVLCCLEGLSQDEAARRLGWSPGSVRGRLERGRERLRSRLARRGITLAAGAGAVLIGDPAPAVPPALFARAVEFAAGGPASVAVARLAGAAVPPGVVPKVVGAAILALAAGIVAAVGTAGRSKPPAPDDPKPPESIAAKPGAGTDRFGEPLPAGVVARLGTVRQRHGRALAVWFAPDGKTVHAFGDGPAVRTWDASTGGLLDTKVLPVEYRAEVEANFPGTGHMSFSHELGNAVSRDGRVFAARSEDLTRQRFYDLTAGKLISEVKVPRESGVYAAALSADGNVYVTSEYVRGGGEQQHPVRAFDVRAGTVRTLFRTPHDIRVLFLTPDGKRLVVQRSTFVDGDGVECWDVAGATKVWSQKRGYLAAGLSDDGRTFLGVTGGEERVQALDTSSGRRSDGLRLPTHKDFEEWRFPIGVDSMKVGLHGSLLTMTSDTERVVWDTAAGKLVARLPGGYGPLAVAPDGKSLVTAGDTLQRWEVARGRRMWADNRADGHSGQIRSVRFSPDGRRLVSAGCDTTVREWDVGTRAGRVLARGETAYAEPPVFTPDVRSILIWDTSPDGLVQILALRDADTGQTRRTFRVKEALEGGDRGGIPYEFDVSPDGRAVECVVPIPGPDGQSLTVLARWDLATGKYLGRTVLLPEWHHIALPPDRRTVVTARTPYEAELLDFPTGARKALQNDGHRTVNERLPVVSPDGRLAAAPTRVPNPRPGVPEVGVTVWEAATGRVVDRLPVSAGFLRFTPDGRGLLLADRTGLGVWDLVTRERLAWKPAHSDVRGDFGNSFVSCWDMTRDGRTVATGHPDGTVLLWDVSGATRPTAGPDLTAADLDRHWDTLAGEDAAAAYVAVRELAARPGQAVRFLRERLKPLADGEAVRALIAKLDSRGFAEREGAAKELERLADAAVPDLRRALAGAPSAEQRQRVERLLAAADIRFLPPGDRLRTVRTVGALEWMETPEARALITELAAGADGARLTREAKAAAERSRGR